MACGPCMAATMRGRVTNGPTPIMSTMLSAVAGQRVSPRTRSGLAEPDAPGCEVLCIALEYIACAAQAQTGAAHLHSLAPLASTLRVASIFGVAERAMKRVAGSVAFAVTQCAGLAADSGWRSSAQRDVATGAGAGARADCGGASG